MRPDPSAQAVWHALDVATAIAAVHPGAPILVANERGVVRWPTGVTITTGRPVVEMVVQSDGVVVISTRRRAPRASGAEFVAYPTRGGSGFTTDPGAVLSPAWRGLLASAVDRALAALPAAGQALASP